MKHRILTLAVLACSLFGNASAQTERLSRGVVALPMAKGNIVTWRLLDTDDKNVTFDVLRNNAIIASNLSGATCFTDAEGTSSSVYSVRAYQRGTVENAFSAQAWAQPFLSIPIVKPADGVSPDGRTYTYTPNDCTTGDVDGDGEYELILKWDPSNSHDNAHDGYTGDVIIDCYKIPYANLSASQSASDNAASSDVDGVSSATSKASSTSNEASYMWRINLGKNIRAGAHYTQMLVYDFDGDGKAELICKTAPGSVDGKGRFVTEAATDKNIRKDDNSKSYVNERGRILSGPEYLTVFSGIDGHAVHTIYYNPNRAFGVGGSADYATKKWGDGNPGNRGERFLACVANLEGVGKNASAVMCRGYYTGSYLWAVDFDGRQLTTKWLHCSDTRSSWAVKDGKGKVVKSAGNLKATAHGQGAHSLAVGDVDGDGCDEITYGSAAIDHDGTLLYSTGLGHGDAQHLGDFDPDRAGLEYFMPHEARPYGSDFRDARTGEILFRNFDKTDTGRGLCADIDSLHRGAEFWCSASREVFDVKGNVITELKDSWLPTNFRIYWDGDAYDELLGNGSARIQPGSPEQRGGRGPRRGTAYIAKWNGNGCDHVTINGKDLSDYNSSALCNGTKATPCLQADLFGDWREEIILYDASDRAHLNVFTTNIPTKHRVVTLMHDHIYRMGVAWQNVTYNQPPHLGYYLPDAVK